MDCIRYYYSHKITIGGRCSFSYNVGYRFKADIIDARCMWSCIGYWDLVGLIWGV